MGEPAATRLLELLDRLYPSVRELGTAVDTQQDGNSSSMHPHCDGHQNTRAKDYWKHQLVARKVERVFDVVSMELHSFLAHIQENWQSPS